MLYEVIIKTIINVHNDWFNMQIMMFIFTQTPDANLHLSPQLYNKNMKQACLLIIA